MSAPSTRAARHALIERLIASVRVHSQAELRELLAEEGVEVTQTTVSRDLDELRAVKVRDSTGQQVYALRDAGGYASESEHVHARLERWCQEVLIGADHAENLAVMRTPPGAAQLLASAIDLSSLPDVLGCVAGDDTVLVITRSEPVAGALVTRLLALAKGTTTSTPDGDTSGYTAERKNA